MRKILLLTLTILLLVSNHSYNYALDNSEGVPAGWNICSRRTRAIRTLLFLGLNTAFCASSGNDNNNDMYPDRLALGNQTCLKAETYSHTFLPQIDTGHEDSSLFCPDRSLLPELNAPLALVKEDEKNPFTPYSAFKRGNELIRTNPLFTQRYASDCYIGSFRGEFKKHLHASGSGTLLRDPLDPDNIFVLTAEHVLDNCLYGPSFRTPNCQLRVMFPRYKELNTTWHSYEVKETITLHDILRGEAVKKGSFLDSLSADLDISVLRLHGRPDLDLNFAPPTFSGLNKNELNSTIEIDLSGFGLPVSDASSWDNVIYERSSSFSPQQSVLRLDMSCQSRPEYGREVLVGLYNSSHVIYQLERPFISGFSGSGVRTADGNVIAIVASGSKPYLYTSYLMIGIIATTSATCTLCLYKCCLPSCACLPEGYCRAGGESCKVLCTAGMCYMLSDLLLWGLKASAHASGSSSFAEIIDDNVRDKILGIVRKKKKD